MNPYILAIIDYYAGYCPICGQAECEGECSNGSD